jgi:hypothetical protein
LENVKGRDRVENLSIDDRIKKKGKFHPRTRHEGPEIEMRYSSILSLNLALDVVGSQRHAPVKDSYLLMAG